MNKSVFVTIILIIFISCKNETTIRSNNAVKKEFQISANLEGFKNGTKVLVSNAVNGKILDSSELINGKFVSKGSIQNPPKPISILIQNDNGRAISFLYIGNEKINIQGNKKDFPNKLRITGSKFHKYKEDLDLRIDSLENARSENLQKMFTLRRENKWNDSFQKVYWAQGTGIIPQIDSKIDKIKRDYISNNINSDYALFQLVTNKSSFDNQFIETQLRNLNYKFKKSEYATVLRTYIESKTLEKGDSFYDFKAENQLGNEVKFSNYFQDNYILLEFYSSYCSWCKKALPEIKKIANENNDLEVVTFNVDSNKEDWLKNYKNTKKTWPSLYDEKGRLGEVFTKYCVYATPTYYLFDKDGKLVKKWNGYTENFRNQVHELL